MEEEEFHRMLPDAVSCIVILKTPDAPERLLLTREYRYPLGRFVLSIPAGLLDREDRETACPQITAAIREIREETGLELGPGDRVELAQPLLFSTPGMTDESNALVCAVAERENLSFLDQSGAVGGELFDGFLLVTKEEARELLHRGKDSTGRWYSMFTWAALMWFVSGMWEQRAEIERRR